MSDNNLLSEISLTSVIENPRGSKIKFWLARLADRVMGLNKLQSIYDDSGMSGCNAHDFGERFCEVFNTSLEGEEALAEKVPREGSLILVSNHPFGCMEGIVLAHALAKLRPDVKVLANTGLQMFKEIESHFIFINPLKANDPANLSALKQCKSHLKQGGLLLVFPAGKVSYYRPEKKRVCDDEWNRLPAHLARTTDSPVLPIFVEGQNSRFFINMGRIYFRFKLLLLFREMMKHRNQNVTIRVGNLLSTKLLSKMKSVELINDYLRCQTYAQASEYINQWPEDVVSEHLPLQSPVAPELLAQEVAALDESQRLADYKQFSVFYCRQHQAPNVIADIARLRERVFRLYNEGSGQPCDTDEFDATYLHLFIFDNEAHQIIGAYRMGQSDVLLREQGLKGLYLSRMFDFSPNFINHKEPCLEMGRSFIVPEHQRSFYGLFLLWRGIGEFVVRHPQYRTLYGTVSLSKLYKRQSVECIEKLALTPSSEVSPVTPFEATNNPELNEFIVKHNKTPGLLSILVQGLEDDGKDVPILMKQYEKLAARFYTVGIDKNFNHTPGLLLSVHLPSAPTKALKQYLSDGLEQYLAFENR